MDVTSKMISVRLPEDVRRDLGDYCAATHTNMTAVLVEAARQLIAAGRADPEVAERMAAYRHLNSDA